MAESELVETPKEKLYKAIKVFEQVAVGTQLSQYKETISLHIKHMQEDAAACRFTAIAGHMRELGDESRSLDDIMDRLVIADWLSDRQQDEINGAIADIWIAADSFISDMLQEHCACKVS